MKKIAIIITTFLVIALVGCEKNWLDINKDPNVPFVAQPNKLLTGAQVNFGYTFCQSNYIGGDLLTYVHQLSSREVDQYSMSATGSIQNTWLSHYAGVMPNINELIRLTDVNANPTGNLSYAGIAKIMKAYSYMVMIDLFGNIPYSEANVAGNIAPAIDTASTIYNTLFVLIDDAIVNLQSTPLPNLMTPKDDDLIYGGNTAKWIRLGNTLKLRLLLNTRLTQDKISGYTQKLADLMTANNFILPDEDFEFWFNEVGTPDQRHQAFVDEYGGGQVTYYISPWFYEIMKGLTINATNNPFANVADPRVPYYWFNQLTGGDAENATDYRHENFVSIVFGSIGPNRDMAQRVSATMIGFYPCGGKYDNGVGGGRTGLTIENGDGVAPQKMMTYASSRFMLAELAITGVIPPGNAPVYYEEGVRAALAHVNKSVAKTTQTGVPQLSAAAINTFVTSLMTRYNTATDERKLEMIITQKWIHNFFNPVESYTDYRRTGYPVLFDPRSGVAIVPINADGEVNTELPVQLVRKYPKSMWYPQREVELNPNFSQKPDLSAARVFWDTRTYDY